MSTSESPPPSGHKGLSKEAWVAIGTIAAALITGIVTVIVHTFPKPSASPTPAATPTAVASAPAATPVVITADAIAGKWAGEATDSTGKSFDLTLEIKKSCGINERCGMMSVSHVPCYGEIFLERTRDRDFEFRTDNFYGESDREKCQSGPGEYFRLRPDGKLDYWTTYEPEAKGVLERNSS